MSIGGCVLALQGNGCVAIATDHRLGCASSFGQRIAGDFKKVFKVGPRMFVGLTGFLADVNTVWDRLRYRQNLYEIKENCEMSPEAFTTMLSNLLYEYRFGPCHVQAVVAALNACSLQPYICSIDLIGAPTKKDSFVFCGNCDKQMQGMCETLWTPNLEPEELFVAMSQTLTHAFDRNITSGSGATVYLIEGDKIMERVIDVRMD
ncbi:proteasome subunit beta type-3-like [Drosophila subobscura]|uniref:proteasome subunit beta type-3-like n=1 Tax=Drosophila subobscura TaxID=7241 RepID=UPI00155A6045|nr:proteasome subunit beta type-3-like [Drosophila subobscura]